MTLSGPDGIEQSRQPDENLAADRKELYQRARAAVQNVPDIRAERVASLRERIQAGTYYVPDHLLAQKLLEFVA